MVSGALPLGQAVLVTDARHQILEARDPGPRLLSGAGHQVQGLHVLSVVQAEATVGVEAAICVALEDLGLLPLAHLPHGVHQDCQRNKSTVEWYSVTPTLQIPGFQSVVTPHIQPYKGFGRDDALFPPVMEPLERTAWLPLLVCFVRPCGWD